MADDLIGKGSIERYEVVVSDARGISESVHPWGFKELSS
jgi:ribosomal protein S6